MKLDLFKEKIKALFKSKKAIAIISACAALLAVCAVILVVILTTGGASEGDSEYTVVFSTDGGGFIPSQKLAAGSKIREPEAPEKHGYIFGGWSFHGTAWRFDTDTVKSNVILNAIWREAVTVSFDDGFGVYEIKIAKEQPIKASDIPTEVADGVLAWYEGGVRRNLSLPTSSDLYLTAGYGETLRVSKDARELLLRLYPDVEEHLGITLAESDSDCDITLALVGASGGEGSTDLLLFEKHLPHLTAFLSEHGDSLELIRDGALVSVPLPAKQYSLTARAEWIRLLLDNGTLSDATGLISNGHCLPVIEGDSLSVAFANGKGTITKKLSVSDNALSLLNAYADGGITAKNAQIIFTNYVDRAYSSYYKNKPSELFVGDGAAYDTDELTALLRIAVACPSIFGHERVGGIFVDKNDITALASLMTVLFGTESAESALSELSLTDFELLYSGTSEEIRRDVKRFNRMLSEGLISFSTDIPALIYYVEDGEKIEDTKKISVPASVTVTEEDGSSSLVRLSRPLAYDGAHTLSISSLSSADRRILLSALRLIDYLYL